MTLELFDHLPEGMTAAIDRDAKIIYIYQTPHTLIDCLDRLVSGWRDVLYVNTNDVFEKVKADPIARESLIQPLFAILASANMNGFDVVAFHPATITPGTAVYRDTEGNIRPSLGFDPVNAKEDQRPIMGISMGIDEEGRTRMMVTGTFTVTAPKLTIYIQPDSENDA